MEILGADELVIPGAAGKVGVGRADPFVRLDVDRQIRRTPIARKTLKPTWGGPASTFQLLVADLDTRVRLRVLDDQLLGINDRMGEFEFSVSHLAASKVIMNARKHLRTPANRASTFKPVVDERNAREKKAGRRLFRRFKRTPRPSGSGLRRGETEESVMARAAATAVRDPAGVEAEIVRESAVHATPPRTPGGSRFGRLKRTISDTIIESSPARLVRTPRADLRGFSSSKVITNVSKVHAKTAVRAVDISLLLIGQKRERLAVEEAATGHHVISEKDLVSPTPLEVWLKLAHVQHGRLRVRMIYRDFERTRSGFNVAMGENFKERKGSFDRSNSNDSDASGAPAAAAAAAAGGGGDDDDKEYLDSLFLAAVYVEVVEASELAPHASRRARSAFVTLSVGRDKYATRTATNANHPKWDEAANFYIASTADPILHLTVAEAGSDATGLAAKTLAAAGVGSGTAGATKLGELLVPLNEAHFGDVWLALNNTPSGKVHLVITPRYLDARAFPRPEMTAVQAGEAAHELAREGGNGSTEWRRNARANPSAALWQPKEDATECMRCAARFGVLRRKHHCRACLRVFCTSCVQKRSDVPSYGNRRAMYICLNCYSNTLAGATIHKDKVF